MKFSITKQLWMMCLGFLSILSIVGFVGLKISDVYRAKLEKVSKVDVTVIRNLTNADMLHDGLRAVVMESIVAKSFSETDKISELKKEVKEKGVQFIGYFNELEKLPLSENVKKLISDVMPAISKYQSVSYDMVQVVDTQGVEAARTHMGDFNQTFELYANDYKFNFNCRWNYFWYSGFISYCA